MTAPLNYIETDDVNDRMVQDVKWENGFVGVAKEFIVETQKSLAKPQ